jgi:5-methylcytosine-specific restriction endonuclease McrA
MKKCSRCNEVKPESEYFFKNRQTGRLHAQCKECYREHRSHYYKQHYETYKARYRERAKIRRTMLRTEFRTNMLKYLDKKSCELCGETDIRTFEFDHIIPAEKSFSISQAVSLGHSWGDVTEEMKKCRILCANCHKKQTAEQVGWYKV